MRRGACILVFFCVVVVAAGCGEENRSGDAQRRPSSVALDELEKRPLRLPTVAGGIRDCPQVGAIHLPGIPAEGGLGPPGLAALREGPVYPVLLAGPPRIAYLSGLSTAPAAAEAGLADSKWRPVETLWVSRATYDGPVLVRGRRLDKPEWIGVGEAVAPNWELRLPAGSWSQVGFPVERNVRPRDGWRVTRTFTRIRGEGCYAFRVDGVGFSYSLAFWAT